MQARVSSWRSTSVVIGSSPRLPLRRAAAGGFQLHDAPLGFADEHATTGLSLPGDANEMTAIDRSADGAKPEIM